MNSTAWRKPMKGVDAFGQLAALAFPKYIQPKYDGIRVIFYNGVALSASFKPLANEELQTIARNFPSLDGVECEYFVPPSEGGFAEASSICRRADRPLSPGALYAFDQFHPDLPYTDRLSRLATSVRQPQAVLNLFIAPTSVVSRPSEVFANLRTALDSGHEGIMIKSMDAVYKQGRSTLRSQECLKLKPFVDDDAVVIGWKPEYYNANAAFTDELGRTARSSAQDGKFAKELVGALECQCPKFAMPFWVSGFTMEQKEAMWLNRERLVGKTLCFKHQPCDCYDAPRHPIFRRWI